MEHQVQEVIDGLLFLNTLVMVMYFVVGLSHNNCHSSSFSCDVTSWSHTILSKIQNLKNGSVMNLQWLFWEYYQIFYIKNTQYIQQIEFQRCSKVVRFGFFAVTWPPNFSGMIMIDNSYWQFWVQLNRAGLFRLRHSQHNGNIQWAQHNELMWQV